MMQSTRIEPTMHSSSTDMIRCKDGCGAEHPTNPEGIDPPGWQRFEFGRGLRCPLCVKVLRLINNYSESEHTTAAITR